MRRGGRLPIEKLADYGIHTIDAMASIKWDALQEALGKNQVRTFACSNTERRLRHVRHQ